MILIFKKLFLLLWSRLGSAQILQSLLGGAENLLISEAAHGAGVQTSPVEGPTQRSEDW